jgi:hemoglobin
MAKLRRAYITLLLFAVLPMVMVSPCLFGVPKPNAAAQDTMSLYDRLGGLDAIKAVIDDFVGRVAADDRINKKFAKTNIPRVKFFLVQQVCAATGGPCKYEGNSMPKAHKNMKVTAGEFDALVGDLVASLDHFNVPAAEKNELLGILGPLKSQIVEVNTSDTGQPLPANFKPAKPLSKKTVDAGPAYEVPKPAKICDNCNNANAHQVPEPERRNQNAPPVKKSTPKPQPSSTPNTNNTNH